MKIRTLLEAQGPRTLEQATTTVERVIRHKFSRYSQSLQKYNSSIIKKVMTGDSALKVINNIISDKGLKPNTRSQSEVDDMLDALFTKPALKQGERRQLKKHQKEIARMFKKGESKAAVIDFISDKYDLSIPTQVKRNPNRWIKPRSTRQATEQVEQHISHKAAYMQKLLQQYKPEMIKSAVGGHAINHIVDKVIKRENLTDGSKKGMRSPRTREDAERLYAQEVKKSHPGSVRTQLLPFKDEILNQLEKGVPARRYINQVIAREGIVDKLSDFKLRVSNEAIGREQAENTVYTIVNDQIPFKIARQLKFRHMDEIIKNTMDGVPARNAIRHALKKYKINYVLRSTKVNDPNTRVRGSNRSARLKIQTVNDTISRLPIRLRPEAEKIKHEVIIDVLKSAKPYEINIRKLFLDKLKEKNLVTDYGKAAVVAPRQDAAARELLDKAIAGFPKIVSSEISPYYDDMLQKVKDGAPAKQVIRNQIQRMHEDPDIKFKNSIAKYAKAVSTKRASAMRAKYSRDPKLFNHAVDTATNAIKQYNSLGKKELSKRFSDIVDDVMAGASTPDSIRDIKDKYNLFNVGVTPKFNKDREETLRNISLAKGKLSSSVQQQLAQHTPEIVDSVNNGKTPEEAIKGTINKHSITEHYHDTLLSFMDNLI